MKRRAATPRGRFGQFGGQYVAETLMPALEELEAAFERAQGDAAFGRELADFLAHHAGRPTPLTFARRLTEALRGARIYLKREDLCHTGAHKINNCLGQALLARRMGKPRIIAETGAGQHGVATATAAALFGQRCEVYMGTEDMRRQAQNVLRMRLLGATVHPVDKGTRTLKDALNEALRDWTTNVRDTHYLIGSVAGPHPFPTIVRTFQSVISREARAQLREAEGRDPDACVACVGGGSNAMGLFAEFVDDPAAAPTALVGVEPEGAATLTRGRVGVLHGARSYLLCDDDGQVSPAHSIAAGLDYPGVGPEHAHLKATGRATYVAVSDAQALAGFQLLARTEGILCALETAHAIAHVVDLAPRLGKNALILVCLSGRGDKDMDTIAEKLAT